MTAVEIIQIHEHVFKFLLYSLVNSAVIMLYRTLSRGYEMSVDMIFFAIRCICILT
jgi:hypothetical protein